MSEIKNIKSREQFFKKNVNESVFKQNDVFKVKLIVDVPTSVVNAFIRKVKQEKGPDAMDMWSTTDIAEILVKYATDNFIDAESIPVSAVTGESKAQPSAQAQPVEEQPVTAQPVVTQEVQPVVEEPIVEEPALDLPDGSIEA